MFAPFIVISLIIILTEIITGIFGNGFIAVIYYTHWVKRRKLSSCDMILICLGVSRIILLGSFTANLLISTFNFWMIILDQIQITLYFLYWFASIADISFAACLSVFYCVKITCCNQALFLRMKQRISVMVPKLLLGSLLVPSVSSIPYIWGEYNLYNLYHCSSTGDLYRNRTVADTSWDVSRLYFNILYSATSFIPFIIFLSSSILLISSLWRHTRQMQNNATSFWDPSTEAHVRAIKAMISCLLLYIFNFVAVSIKTLPTCLTEVTWTPVITSIVIAAYPSGHCLILILINPKLKQALVRILRSIKCHLTEGISKSYHETPDCSRSQFSVLVKGQEWFHTWFVPDTMGRKIRHQNCGLTRP